jgi:hypothetical protein
MKPTIILSKINYLHLEGRLGMGPILLRFSRYEMVLVAHFQCD